MDIKVILKKHKLYIATSGKKGEKADLRWADLRWADLSEADLRWADLSEADLRWADLSYSILSWADLSGAKLSGADLSGADLSGADLSGADLSGAVGNKKQIKSLQIERWDIVYTKTQLAIGCKQHEIEEWHNFSDEKIIEMDSSALEWWNKWKDTIFKIIEISPAED